MKCESELETGDFISQVVVEYSADCDEAKTVPAHIAGLLLGQEFSVSGTSPQVELLLESPVT